MKKFLIIGNKNACSYYDVFKLFKDNKITMGYTVPDLFIDPSGNIVDKLKGMSRWFCNLENKASRPLNLTKLYNPTEYLFYDNYKALNIDKIKDIPVDYTGLMGVPITILQYDLKGYEIVGIADRQDHYNLRTKKYGPQDMKNYNDMNPNAVLKIDGKYISKYSRVMIRKVADI